MHWIGSGPPDGVPVVLVRGDLSTGRLHEHILAGAPVRYRFIAPDMRGFGGTQAPDLDDRVIQWHRVTAWAWISGTTTKPPP